MGQPGSDIKQILVASDLSSRSEAALRRAASIAIERGWDLRILHVVDDEHPTKLAEQERASRSELLEAEAERFRRGTNSNVTVAVAIGDPYREIVKDAERLGADLIVLGRHRRRPLRDFIVGTTVDRVLRSTAYPILVVKDGKDISYRQVLAATDLSESSRHALRVAERLGFLDRGFLSVIHAFHVIGKGSLRQASIPEERIADIVEQNHRAATVRLQAFLRRSRLDHESRLIIIEGDPLSSIRRTVTERQPDLLVVGTSGRGRLSRGLLGSVATGLMNGVSCDVLAVPPTPH